MSKSVGSVAAKSALPQGALVHVGESAGLKASVSIIRYGPESFSETEGDAWNATTLGEDAAQVTWLRVRGISDLDKIRLVGERFGLHALVLEDVINTDHRPKLEDFEDYLFLVGRRLQIAPEGMKVTKKQSSLILGRGWVISFGEDADSTAYSPMVERLRKGVGRSRKLGADYLFSALLDIMVDSYFQVVEALEDRVEEIENEVMDQPDERVLTRIYHLKRQVLQLRRTIWPMREAANALIRDEFPLIGEQVLPFVRDIYDHTTHVLEATDALRENLSALLDLCLSQAGNRMNQVMKVLTIIATIFIPLTFLAGLYGMNFKYMPELDLAWSYPALLVVMSLMALVMILFFRRKRWL